MGAERRSMIMSDEDKRITAYPRSGPRARRAAHARGFGSRPQGDDHSARHGARPDADASRGGSAQLHRAPDLRGDPLCDGWARCRGNRLRPLLDRRLERPAAGDELGAADGDRVRHEQGARPGLLRGLGGGRLPRPRSRVAQGLQRAEGARDRRRGLRHPGPEIRRGAGAAARESGDRSTGSPRLPARARDARGSRSSRSCSGASRCPMLRTAGSRPAPPARAIRSVRPGAARRAGRAATAGGEIPDPEPMPS